MENDKLLHALLSIAFELKALRLQLSMRDQQLSPPATKEEVDVAASLNQLILFHLDKALGNPADEQSPQ